MYRLIEQHTKINFNALPKGANQVNYSMLTELSPGEVIFRGFSVKYVIEGIEPYWVNGKRYDVGKGQYLLANAAMEGYGELHSQKIVKGICIDISPEITSEALANQVTPDCPFPDIGLDKFFNGEEFLENKYLAGNTKLGETLMQTGHLLSENPYANHHFDNEFYYTLAEKVVEDYQPLITQLYKINTVKHQTRKDLYRRLCLGKDFLDQNFNRKMSINDAAQYAMLSEYHFFRLFKSTFKITPHQYIIQRRLNHSLSLLKSGNYSVTETADVCGFSDMFSFSKSFKKQFGISPSEEVKLAGFYK